MDADGSIEAVTSTGSFPPKAAASDFDPEGLTSEIARSEGWRFGGL
jgi:hypothetical protein